MNHEQLGMSIMQLIGSTLLDQCSAKLLQGLERESHIYGFDNARIMCNGLLRKPFQL